MLSVFECCRRKLSPSLLVALLLLWKSGTTNSAPAHHRRSFKWQGDSDVFQELSFDWLGDSDCFQELSSPRSYGLLASPGDRRSEPLPGFEDSSVSRTTEIGSKASGSNIAPQNHLIQLTVAPQSASVDVAAAHEVEVQAQTSKGKSDWLGGFDCFQELSPGSYGMLASLGDGRSEPLPGFENSPVAQTREITSKDSGSNIASQNRFTQLTVAPESTSVIVAPAHPPISGQTGHTPPDFGKHSDDMTNVETSYFKNYVLPIHSNIEIDSLASFLDYVDNNYRSVGKEHVIIPFGWLQIKDSRGPGPEQLGKRKTHTMELIVKYGIKHPRKHLPLIHLKESTLRIAHKRLETLKSGIIPVIESSFSHIESQTGPSKWVSDCKDATVIALYHIHLLYRLTRPLAHAEPEDKDVVSRAWKMLYTFWAVSLTYRGKLEKDDDLQKLLPGNYYMSETFLKSLNSQIPVPASISRSRQIAKVILSQWMAHEDSESFSPYKYKSRIFSHFHGLLEDCGIADALGTMHDVQPFKKQKQMVN